MTNIFSDNYFKVINLYSLFCLQEIVPLEAFSDIPEYEWFHHALQAKIKDYYEYITIDDGALGHMKTKGIIDDEEYNRFTGKRSVKKLFNALFRKNNPKIWPDVFKSLQCDSERQTIPTIHKAVTEHATWLKQHPNESEFSLLKIRSF